jgi:hypothetical protein
MHFHPLYIICLFNLFSFNYYFYVFKVIIFMFLKLLFSNIIYNFSSFYSMRATIFDFVRLEKIVDDLVQTYTKLYYPV